MQLMSAPEGFPHAIRSINKVSALSQTANVLRDLVPQLLCSEQKGHHEIGMAELVHPYAQKFQVAGGDAHIVSDEQVQNICRACQYIFSAARKHKATTEVLFGALRATTGLTEGAATLVCRCWKDDLAAAAAAPKQNAHVFSVGKLLDLKWRLGVSISSSACRDLQAPFVGLQLKVANGAGATKSHAVELPLSDFHRMHSALRSAMKHLDEV